MIEQLEALTVF